MDKISRTFVRLSVLTIIVLPQIGHRASGQDLRSTIDIERGQYYGYADSWPSIGAAVLNPHNANFAVMLPEAIKAMHGHFQHVAPADPGDDFPYGELKTYEAAEIAAGRPPIFVTASYGGKPRPVYFEWHLALDGSGRPTAQPSEWSQAVNIRDDRFIRFYINVYLRKTLWKPYMQNLWHAVDNCSFRYNNYGVLDDNGIYHSGISWDTPFSQSDSDFLDSIKYFLTRVQQLAPDVHIMGNEGSMNNESRFSDVWSGFAGTIREDIVFGFAGDSYSRSEMYKAYNRYQWESSAGKTAILRALLPSESDPAFFSKLRTAYAAYLVFRGPNFFFGPRYDDGTVMEVPGDRYAAMRNSLGRPTGAAQSQQISGSADPNNRLYWRYTEGGLAYLNWTGLTQTITLPTTQTFWDRTGKQVASLTIPDLQGDFVMTNPAPAASRPAIMPRRSGAVTGPLAVTLSVEGAGISIRYTLDGIDPTASSPVYSGPIILNSSATVKAKSFCSGCAPSFIASASYTITSSLPLVNFYSASDNATQSFSAYYPLLTLSNVSAKPITVNYVVTGGTAVPGIDYQLSASTATFNPGEIYSSFPLTVIGSGSGQNKTVVLSLLSPVNGVLGSQATFTYTIGASPGSVGPVALVRSNGAPSGSLPAGTTSTTLSLTTDKAAVCRYSTTAGTVFGSMSGVFTITGDTAHSTAVSGIQPGVSYTYYVRCQDLTGGTNSNDFPIVFSVATTPIISTSLTPAVATLNAGQTLQLTAVVSGTANQSVSWSITPTVGTITAGGLLAAPSILTGNQTVSIRATSNADSTKSATASISLVAAPQTSTLPIRINAGGSVTSGASGETWIADKYFSGGSVFAISGVVSGTNSPQLYSDGRSGEFVYSIPVPNGTYSVTMKYAEPTFTREGQRVFTVVINGDTVDSNFDPVGYAGGAAKALDRAYSPIVVNKGILTINVVPKVGQPIVNGIQVDAQ